MQANQSLAKMGRAKRAEQQHPGTKNSKGVIQIQSIVRGCAGQTVAQCTAQHSTIMPGANQVRGLTCVLGSILAGPPVAIQNPQRQSTKLPTRLLKEWTRVAACKPTTL